MILIKEKTHKKFLSVGHFLIFEDIATFRDFFIKEVEELRLNITIKIKDNEVVCYKETNIVNVESSPRC